MCGRFALVATSEQVAELFGLAESAGTALGLGGAPALAPRYNIAPTQPVGAVRERLSTPGRTFDLFRWGLVPSWSKALPQAPLINARAETVAEKPSFRAAFKYRRCLVPASGFYEWQKVARGKQPYFIHRLDGELMALAGLWETWHGPDGIELDTCTIITTAANELMAPLHDRMPVVLEPPDFDVWLDPAVKDATMLEPLLRPCADDLLTLRPVGTYVNSAGHEGPECLSPP